MEKLRYFQSFIPFYIFIFIVSLQPLNSLIAQNPINDSPCMTNSNPPYDLGMEGAHTGTTCNAIGYNDDPNADIQNAQCSAISDDNAVWYRAEYNPSYDGVNINVTAGSIGDNVSVEVYVGDEDGMCSENNEFRKSKCDGLPVINMHIGCLDTFDYIFIKVASSDNDCGTFNITVSQVNDCNIADECSDITSAQTFIPVTPDGVSVNYTCLNGCLDLACPSDITGGCDFSQNPTVWYRVNTDAEAGQLYTTVSTSGSWTPIWSVWYPDLDCDNLVNAAGTGSFPCSSESTPPDLLITGVTDMESFYISVTADPNGEPIDDPNFEICVATIKSVVSCIVDNTVWEITKRENTDAEPNGPPYQGPFCPGEELSVHITFHYDATKTGADWLLGLIPEFGCGWDMENFDYNANAPTGNERIAEWYEEDGPCPPQMMENVGHLCTYTDADGHLRLINTLWELIPLGVKCSEGLNKYDTLPSGYFWVQDGNSPDCDASNCSPSRKYGIGAAVVDITWDFTMKIKEFDNTNDCLDCNDLSIIFQTFSDGAAGCWDDPVAECLIDKPQWSPSWKVNCAIPPGVVAKPQPQEICAGEEAGILVYTDDGSQETIDISYNDNPNVTGEKEHTFYQGSGTIDDTLSIVDSFACKPEIVTYYAQVIDNSNICGSDVDTIVVTVYPKPVFAMHKTDIKYGGDSLGSAYISLFCSDSLYSYLWSTGDTLDSISGLSEGVYYVTVTNQYGCSKTDSVIIENIICSDVIYDKTDMNCYGECLGSIQIENVENGIPPYSYIWSTGDTTAMIDSLCAGMYFVTVTGVDSCSSVDSIEIISPLEFNLVTDLADAKCYGECNGAILINDVENAVKPISYHWDSGDTTSYRLNICAGTYYVTVTDSIGCSHAHTFVINEPDEINITIDSTRDVRATPLGYIAITGRENYIYNWTGPDSFESDSQSIFGLNKAGCYTLTVTDTLTNCTTDTTICISDKTGTLEEYDGFNINIYPNPADDIIYFDLKNNDIRRFDVKIYNIAGGKMKKFQITKDKTIYPMDTQNFSQGLYIYKISTEKGVKVGTFIINR